MNWKEVTKNGFSLKTGDIISIRQKGRLEVRARNVTLTWFLPYSFISVGNLYIGHY